MNFEPIWFGPSFSSALPKRKLTLGHLDSKHSSESAVLRGPWAFSAEETLRFTWSPADLQDPRQGRLGSSTSRLGKRQPWRLLMRLDRTLPASGDSPAKQESWRLGSSQQSEISKVTEAEETPRRVRRMLVEERCVSTRGSGPWESREAEGRVHSSVCWVVTRRMLSTELYKQKICSWMWTRTSDFNFFSNKFTFYYKLDTFWGGPPHAALELS